MPIEDIRVGVSIAAPGSDSNDYVIFDSAAASPPMDLATLGIDRIMVGWNNSQAATLKFKYLRAGTTATYDVNQSFSRSRNSPFHGRTFRGGPMATVVNGQVAWKRG